jgi:Tfp pilus assembly protein PilE
VLHVLKVAEVVVEVVTVVATIATVVNPAHSDYQKQISKGEANASLFC